MNNKEIEAAMSMPGGLKLIEALKARLGWKANLSTATTYLKDIEAKRMEVSHKQLSLIELESILSEDA